MEKTIEEKIANLKTEWFAWAEKRAAINVFSEDEYRTYAAKNCLEDIKKLIQEDKEKINKS